MRKYLAVFMVMWWTAAPFACSGTNSDASLPDAMSAIGLQKGGCGCAPSRATGGFVCMTRTLLFLSAGATQQISDVVTRYGSMVAIGAVAIALGNAFPRQHWSQRARAYGTSTLFAVLPSAVSHSFSKKTDMSIVNLTGACTFFAAAKLYPELAGPWSPLPQETLSFAGFLTLVESANDHFAENWERYERWYQNKVVPMYWRG